MARRRRRLTELERAQLLAQEQDIARVKAVAVQLSEHFDSVLVLCTRQDGSRQVGTQMVSYGQGNRYANYGAAADYARGFERESSG